MSCDVGTFAAMGTRSLDPRRPNLFIVGAPHAGTTSLFAYLSAHPDVFPARVKEPFFFFGPDARFEPRLETKLDDYLALSRAGSTRATAWRRPPAT